MAKNKENITETSNGLPLLIIGGVLVVAIIGGLAYFKSSAPTPTPTKTPTPGNNPVKNPPNQSPTPATAPTIVSQVRGADPPHFKGSVNAPVVIEEFSDFQCPTCGAMNPLFNEIAATYGNRIKFIYRNFPLSQIHPNAYDASLAAEAAGMQGKFWDMQNLIFQNQQRWSTASGARALFESYAGTLGLDVEKFKTDMSGLTAKQRVDADMERGKSLGVGGTPAVYINNRPVAFDQMTGAGMQAIIDGELAKLSGGAGKGQNQATTVAVPSDNVNRGDMNKTAQPVNK